MEGKVVSLYQVKHSLIYRIDFTPSAPIIEAKVGERQLREKVEISSGKNNF